jgi:hypothetical protein
MFFRPFVIPAKAGIQFSFKLIYILDSPRIKYGAG